MDEQTDIDGDGSATPDRRAPLPRDAPDAETATVHDVVVEERGAYTVASCTCGWYTPARRSRPLARQEAADHLALHARPSSTEIDLR